MEDNLAPVIVTLVFGAAMIGVYTMLILAAVKDGHIERHHRRRR